MLGRSAIVVIPSVAVAITAVVLLGPGGTRPAVGARVWADAARGSRVLALRVATIERLHGVDTPIAGGDLRVEARAGGAVIGAWSGPSGADGITEARIEAGAPIEAPRVELRVTRDRPGNPVLGEGAIALGEATPVPSRPGTIESSAKDGGAYAIRVDVVRGVLAAPFPEMLRITVNPKDSAPGGAAVHLTITATGGEISAGTAKAESGKPLELAADGSAVIAVKPEAHQVELAITARGIAADAGTARWEGVLPVIPGAIWIDPTAAAGSLVLVSPAPRERAYLSIYNERGRLFGAAVPLARDPWGFYRGSVTPILPPASASRVYAVVAGDPAEQGSGTVTWPLQPAEGVITPAKPGLAIDGMAGAEIAEKHRSGAARRAGALVIAAAALLETLLLLARSRASQRSLEAHLVEASGSAEDGSAKGGAPLSTADRERVLASARDWPILRALVVVALIGFAFAIVAALSTLRAG